MYITFLPRCVTLKVHFVSTPDHDFSIFITPIA